MTQTGKNEHDLADHVTKSKTWREIDEPLRVVGARMKVIKSGKDVGSKGARWNGKSQFSLKERSSTVVGQTQDQSGGACRQQGRRQQ